MSRIVVSPGGPLRGRCRVPGDKSIGHRALIFGSLARGRCVVSGLSGGEDNLATMNAFREMGVRIEGDAHEVEIQGVGLRGLNMPKGVIDCGNSGTSMRLLCGLLSAQRFGVRLVGDESLTKRPMARVVGPLRARGAHIAGRQVDDEHFPPISIAPLVEGEALHGIEYEMPVASAQVKSSLLLSGLFAEGPTMLREPVLSRDHTERMMLALGVPIETFGPIVKLEPRGWDRGWEPFEWQVPGDPSSAAFVLAAALMVEGSQVTVEGVGTNPTRTGFLDLLRLMGAQVEHQTQPEGAGGEPTAHLRTSASQLRGSLVGGEMLVRMIDEVPIAGALAAIAQGSTEVRDAQELRVKETDRIAAMAEVLSAFGAPCEELDDGLRIQGGAPLRGATVDSRGDHRIAMSAAVLGLVANGQTVVNDTACVRTSFPGFVETLASLGAEIREE